MLVPAGKSLIRVVAEPDMRGRREGDVVRPFRGRPGMPLEDPRFTPTGVNNDMFPGGSEGSRFHSSIVSPSRSRR